MLKFLSDIFTMNFDLVIPLSGCMFAIILAFILFIILYLSCWKDIRESEAMAQQAAALMLGDDSHHTPSDGSESASASVFEDRR